MKLIGITGGIGMGKSMTGQLLIQRGMPVQDTDVIARQLVKPGQAALGKIKQTFGSAIVDSNERLCRADLAKIVFADPTAREKLEEILHPAIREVWQKEAEGWRQQKYPLGFIIIPLLFETSAAHFFQSIICVACNHETQKQRLLQRGWTSEQINQRIASQWPIERKIDASDFVIWTEVNVDIHAAQLDHILSRVPCVV